MSNIERALEVALAPQTVIDVNRIVAEMKNNALATSNWEQLVSSAPVALRCLGACFMAAGSKDLTSVQVPMMPGARIQRPPYLQANLVRCSNLGTSAFIVANKGMAQIYQLSAMSENKVYDIINILGDTRAAFKQLPSLLSQLHNSANQCHDVSKEIDDEFSKWLAFTSELFEATQNQSSVVADEQQKAITEKAVAAQKVKDVLAQVQSSKDAMKELGKTMDTAREAYKKASDNQPTGWDIVGQQLVSSLGQCLTTGLSLAIPALVDNMNPMAKAKAAAGIFGDLTDGKKDSAQPNGQKAGNGVSGNTQPAATPQPADPAMAYVQKDLYLYNLLKPMIQAADGNVDWASTKSSESSSGMGFIEGMLAQSKTQLDKQTSKGIVTTTYNQILEDVIKVVGEIIKTAKDDSTALNTQLPAKSSESVVRWQTSFESSYRSIVTLDMQAKSLPYNSPSSSPVVLDPALEKAKVDAQAGQAKAILDHASAQLETTAKTLETTSKIYSETQKLLSEQQGQLADINATLARLTSGAIKLEESKYILISCIALIVELKARIVDLVNFFGTLAAVIKTVSENLVGNWIETIKNATGSTDPKAIFKVGQFTLETAERSMIMNGSITIASYFSFFADVANTWRQVSDKSIFPGLELAESLSVPGDAEAKMAKLNKWSNEAQQHIKTECGKRRQEIQDGMQGRVEEIQGLIKELPANNVSGLVKSLAESVATRIEIAQVGSIKQESDNNAIKIVATPRVI